MIPGSSRYLMTLVVVIMNTQKVLGIHKHYKYKGGNRVSNNKRNSIFEMCLCPRCASVFLNSRKHNIKRINPLDVIKDECDYCRVGKGHDYYVNSYL